MAGSRSGRTRIALGAGLPLLLVLAPACGSAPLGAAGQVQQVLVGYERALSAGDDVTACADVAPATRAAIVAAAGAAARRTPGCAAAVAVLLRRGDIDINALLSGFAIGNVTVSGDLASVPVSLVVDYRKLTEIVRAVLVDGRWLLSDGTGL